MIAEFERAQIQERVVAGLARAKAQGRKLGRPERQNDPDRLATVRGLPVREAARRLGVPRTTLQRALARIPLESTSDFLGKRVTLATCWSGPQSLPLGPYFFSGAGGASLL